MKTQCYLLIKMYHLLHLPHYPSKFEELSAIKINCLQFYERKLKMQI